MKTAKEMREIASQHSVKDLLDDVLRWVETQANDGKFEANYYAYGSEDMMIITMSKLLDMGYSVDCESAHVSDYKLHITW